MKIVYCNGTLEKKRGVCGGALSSKETKVCAMKNRILARIEACSFFLFLFFMANKFNEFRRRYVIEDQKYDAGNIPI